MAPIQTVVNQAVNVGKLAEKTKPTEIKNSNGDTATIGETEDGRTNLAFSPPPIKITLPKQLTSEQKSQFQKAFMGPNGKDTALKVLSDQLGIKDPGELIKLLNKMGVTGVEIDADGKVKYAFADKRPTDATALHNLITVGPSVRLSDVSNNEMFQQILKMPGEVRSEMVKNLVKWVEESRARDIETSKVLAKKKYDEVLSSKAFENKLEIKQIELKAMAMKMIEGGEVAPAGFNTLGIDEKAMVLDMTLALLALKALENKGKNDGAFSESSKPSFASRSPQNKIPVSESQLADAYFRSRFGLSK